MADVTVTAASVKLSGASKGLLVQYGATVTTGQVVYLDATTGTYKLAGANGTAAIADAKGIALTPGAANDYGYIAQSGAMVVLGASPLSQGECYALSGTLGGIAPVTDLAGVGYYVTLLGVATSTAIIYLNIFNSGATDPV